MTEVGYVVNAFTQLVELYQQPNAIKILLINIFLYTFNVASISCFPLMFNIHEKE